MSGLRELTKEELEFEICTLEKNIKVLKCLGGETAEAKHKLALYRSKLLLLQLGNNEKKE